MALTPLNQGQAYFDCDGKMYVDSTGKIKLLPIDPSLLPAGHGGCCCDCQGCAGKSSNTVAATFGTIRNGPPGLAM